MGIDPQTHEPFVNCYGPALTSAADPSTRHMAQWESARLEAEARLSKESLLVNNPTASLDNPSDHFLRLWNSEVGDAFRMVKSGMIMSLTSPDQSQISSTVKCCDSVSGTTIDMAQKKDGSGCSSSNELDDSSDSTLQLLMDYCFNNDMSFLTDHINEFSPFPLSNLP